MRRAPLANSYPAAVALVVPALVPFLLLTSAVLPMSQAISKATGLSVHALDLTDAVSDAAYAVGTVLAVQFAKHLRLRRMLLVYVTTFTVGSALAAWAPSAGVFVGAFVLQGLCTSLLLIAAVPPLVTWPPAKMPVAGAVMNLCVFGAVAAGPSVGAHRQPVPRQAPAHAGQAAGDDVPGGRHRLRARCQRRRRRSHRSGARRTQDVVDAVDHRRALPAELAAAVVVAAAFGLLFRTRFTPVLVAAGLVSSAGAAVSPALFMAGFSLRSAQVQRVFALIELLRGVTAFLVAPVLAFVATAVGGPGGLRSPSGSVSGWSSSPAPSPPSSSRRGAPGCKCPTSGAGRTATGRPGTRRRCWPGGGRRPVGVGPTPTGQQRRMAGETPTRRRGTGGGPTAGSPSRPGPAAPTESVREPATAGYRHPVAGRPAAGWSTSERGDARCR